MNSSLQTARCEYNEYLERTVLPLLGLSKEARNVLGFADVAQKIDNRPIRQKFCEFAIELLEQNLLEHQAERPRALELFKAKRAYELREWQETSNIWEAALWSLVSQQ